MFTLAQYLDFIRERLLALGGVPEEDIRFVTQAAEREVLARLAEQTGSWSRDIVVSALPPETVDAAIRWHRENRLAVVMRMVVRPVEQRSTRFTAMVDALGPLAERLERRLYGDALRRPDPRIERTFGFDPRGVIRSFWSGTQAGLRLEAGGIDTAALDRALAEGDLLGPGLLIGAAWGMYDGAIDTVESAAGLVESLVEIYLTGLPQEVVDAMRQVHEILQHGIPAEMIPELDGMAYRAGTEAGSMGSASLADEITLIYAGMPANPLLRPFWPSVVMGRILAPLFRALAEVILSGTGVGEGSMVFRMAASLMRRLPDLRGPMGRIGAWLRRARSVFRRTGRGPGAHPRSPSGVGPGARPHGTGGTLPGTVTSTVPGSADVPDAGPVPAPHTGPATGDAAPDADAPDPTGAAPARSGAGGGRTRGHSGGREAARSSGTGRDRPVGGSRGGVARHTGEPSARRRGGSAGHRPGPRRSRAGTGPEAVRVASRHRDGTPWAGLSMETARTGGIRTVSGTRLRPDGAIEVEINGYIQEPLPSHTGSGPRPPDTAPRYESRLPRRANQMEVNGVSLRNYQASHLWGPGFGDEARAGIMWAPGLFNQRWLNLGVEDLIREMDVALALDGRGRVWVRAIAQSHPPSRMAGTRARELILRRVEYIVSVSDGADGPLHDVFSLAIDIDPPELGGTVNTPGISRHSGWGAFFSDTDLAVGLPEAPRVR